MYNYGSPIKRLNLDPSTGHKPKALFKYGGNDRGILKPRKIKENNHGPLARLKGLFNKYSINDYEFGRNRSLDNLEQSIDLGSQVSYNQANRNNYGVRKRVDFDSKPKADLMPLPRFNSKPEHSYMSSVKDSRMEKEVQLLKLQLESLRNQCHQLENEKLAIRDDSHSLILALKDDIKSLRNEVNNCNNKLETAGIRTRELNSTIGLLELKVNSLHNDNRELVDHNKYLTRVNHQLQINERYLHDKETLYKEALQNNLLAHPQYPKYYYRIKLKLQEYKHYLLGDNVVTEDLHELLSILQKLNDMLGKNFIRKKTKLDVYKSLHLIHKINHQKLINHLSVINQLQFDVLEVLNLINDLNA